MLNCCLFGFNYVCDYGNRVDCSLYLDMWVLLLYYCLVCLFFVSFRFVGEFVVCLILVMCL